MKTTTTLAVLLIALAAAPAASRAQDDDLIKKIINSPLVASLQVNGAPQSKIIKDPKVQGGSALEIQVPTASSQPWDVAVQSGIIRKINKGDVLIAVAWLKSVKTEGAGPGLVTLRLQGASAPYTGLEEQSFSITPDWAEYQLKTVATDNFAKDTTMITAQLAGAKQTIDVGPIFVLDMGPEKPQA